MREIEEYFLDSPIALTSAYDKLVEKFWDALLARQNFQPQLVEVYQPQIVSEGESPKSPSDSSKEWDDAQTILQGTYVRMWYTTPLSPWRPSLARESYSPECMHLQCASKSRANFSVTLRQIRTQIRIRICL